MIKRVLFFVFSVFIFHSEFFAQPFVRQVEPFPVQANGSPVSQPFAGGINSPQHQFVDIDGDGDYDLFVFDVDQTVDFYRNEGTRFAPNFKLRNGLISLPPFSIWFLMVDFDGDGKVDLCTEDSLYNGIRVYKNTGTLQAPQFTPFIPTLHDTTGADVYAGGNSIPTFADLDADGNLDFISANTIGSVNLYQNIGTNTAPVYQFITGNWQNILILGDSCHTTESFRDHPNHGAAAYRFADLDGDGDLDMFISDLFWTEIFSLNNIGTPQVPQMQCFTNQFPPADPVITTGFNQTSFIDIDGDGDLDLFVGVLAGIVQQNGFIFYRNNGTATLHDLRLTTKNFISTIDVGISAHPTFTDIDNDGDQDMFIGNGNGQLTFFRNTGSSTSPSFVLTDSIYLSVPNGYYFSPAFVDIDHDGDKDLFAGMYDGRIKYFQNTGTAQNPVFVRTAFATDGIDVINTAAPVFVDIDGDGDQDLFVGKKNGSISYYRNDGTDSTFTPVLVTQSFLNISFGNDTYVTPTFGDYDGDGDQDLFFGTIDGRLFFYENTGTATNPQFAFVTETFANIASLKEPVPTFVDIDGDGDMDLLVGNSKGGVHFYMNIRLGTYAVEDEYVPTETELLQNYPNPFNPTTNIEFRIANFGFVSLRVFDLLGKEVATLVNEPLNAGRHETKFDAHNLSSGIYIYRLQTDGTMKTRKIVLMK